LYKKRFFYAKKHNMLLIEEKCRFEGNKHRLRKSMKTAILGKFIKVIPLKKSFLRKMISFKKK